MKTSRASSISTDTLEHEDIKRYMVGWNSKNVSAATGVVPLGSGIRDNSVRSRVSLIFIPIPPWFTTNYWNNSRGRSLALFMFSGQKITHMSLTTNCDVLAWYYTILIKVVALLISWPRALTLSFAPNHLGHSQHSPSLIPAFLWPPL